MQSSCAKLLQWRWYCRLCSTQVPHTYFVSQPLPSHVYLSSNSHPRIAQIDVYTPGLENWLLACSQLVPNCCIDGGILDFAVHMYPTHIRSPNYCHRMIVCPNTGTAKELKFTFIHSGSTFDWFDALNLCQTDEMMDVFWMMFYPDTPTQPALVLQSLFGAQTKNAKQTQILLYHWYSTWLSVYTRGNNLYWDNAICWHIPSARASERERGSVVRWRESKWPMWDQSVNVVI